MCVTGCDATKQDSPGAKPDAGTKCDGTAKPCKNCTPGNVSLEVAKNLLTLKHDRDCRLNIKVDPAGVAASAFRIEIRRASGATWCKLSSSQTMDTWHAVIAGKFKLRGVATICGTEHKTAEQDVEVQFPAYADITGDADVTTALSAAWTATEAECTEAPVNQRRERGFWVRLNTSTNKYETSAVEFGGWNAPADGAGVNLSARTADAPATPDPCAAGATYSVASFHSHTSTAFRAAAVPAGATRGVGPSGADNTADTRDDVPGIVYDYVESPAGSGSIPMGHPKGSAAQMYKSLGHERRTTPP